MSDQENCQTHTCSENCPKPCPYACSSSCKCSCCSKSKCAASRCIFKFLAVAVFIFGAIAFNHMLKKHHKNNVDRFVEISASAEKTVKADYAVWKIAFQNTGNDIKVLQEKLAKDRDLIVKFLKSKGFSDAEISVKEAKITDQHAKTYGSNTKDVDVSVRYIMKSNVKITSENVDAITKANKEADVLFAQGVTISEDEIFQKATNPRYYLKNTNNIEKDLYAECAQKGADTAQNIAQKMNIKIKDVRSILSDPRSEGVQILGQDQLQGSEDRADMRLKGPVKTASLKLKIIYNIE